MSSRIEFDHHLDRLSRGRGYVWPWRSVMYRLDYFSKQRTTAHIGYTDPGFLLEPDHSPPALEADAE